MSTEETIKSIMGLVDAHKNAQAKRDYGNLQKTRNAVEQAIRNAIQCAACPVKTDGYKPQGDMMEIHEIKQHDTQPESLHAEDDKHLQELRSYRITVENRDARIAQLESLLKFADERINKMQEDQTTQLSAAQQGVQPENIREGAPYDNPEFEQLARDMGVWGTAQSAVCAQFWLAATHPTPQGMEIERLRNLLCKMVDQLERRGKHRDGNAPGHGHGIPGVWDRDNGELAGKRCAWCEVWQEALEVHAAAQAKQGGAANG